MMRGKSTLLRIKVLIAFLLCSVILPLTVKAQDEEDNTPVKVDTLLYTIPLTISDRKGTYIAGLKK